MTLATHGLRAWTVSYHPTRRAEELPLVPTPRNEAMDRYFRQTGACGVQMMRGHGLHQLIIDYYSERDFVQKMRAACLLTPFFGCSVTTRPSTRPTATTPAVCAPVSGRMWTPTAAVCRPG